eukprot:g2734.t1
MIESAYGGGITDASSEGVLMTKVYGCLTFATFLAMLLFYAWQLEIETRELFVLHLGLRQDASRLKRFENPLSSSNISSWLNSGNAKRHKPRRQTLVATTSSNASGGRYIPPPMSLPTTKSALILAAGINRDDLESKDDETERGNASVACAGRCNRNAASTRDRIDDDEDDDGIDITSESPKIRLPWFFYGSHERVSAFQEQQSLLRKGKKKKKKKDFDVENQDVVDEDDDDDDEQGKKKRISDDDAMTLAKCHDTIQAAVSQWVIPFEFIDHTDRRPIGAGSAGMVYRADYMGAPVALKQVFTTMMDDDLNEKNLREFANEVTALSRLGNHPFVVQFLGISKCPMRSSKDLMPRLYFVTQVLLK